MLDSAIRICEGGAVNRTDKCGADAYRFEDSLDRWLRREFESLYREVLEEPLPPELTELVRLYEAKLDEEERKNGRNSS